MTTRNEHDSDHWQLCPACECGITRTDYNAGYCTNCNQPLTTEKATMKKDKFHVALDAAGRAHMMAMQRGDHAEVDKLFKHIRRLLQRAAKARS